MIETVLQYCKRMTKTISDARVVATSFVVSIFDVGLNLFIALLTGSAVMLAQALQGLSDLITGGILYNGVKRSKRAKDARYQFGYGRELFFWVLMAGIVMFVGTGGMSVYFGYQQLINPEPVEHTWIALTVLIFGFVTNTYAFLLSLKRLQDIDPTKHWYEQLLHSSLVETKATFLIDVLGSLSAVLGFVSLMLYVLTGNVMFDGLGGIVIGLAMMCVAAILVNDVRGLIVGRAVDAHVQEKIKRTTEAVPGVKSVLGILSMYLGSARLMVIIEVHLQDDLDTDKIEKIVDEIKDSVRQNIPQVHHIQVEVETPDDESQFSISTNSS